MQYSKLVLTNALYKSNYVILTLKNYIPVNHS